MAHKNPIKWPTYIFHIAKHSISTQKKILTYLTIISNLETKIIYQTPTHCLLLTTPYCWQLFKDRHWKEYACVFCLCSSLDRKNLLFNSLGTKILHNSSIRIKGCRRRWWAWVATSRDYPTPCLCHIPKPILCCPVVSAASAIEEWNRGEIMAKP